MSTGESRRPADEAVNDFIRHLASRDFSITTRRIRRHFLEEYLQHVQEAAGTVGARLPLTDVAERLYAAAQGAGHGAEDLAVVITELARG